MDEVMTWAATWRLTAESRELFGYFASSMVLATFCMKSMRWLRIAAVISNFAFIFYALVCDLKPILVLHAILLPVNVSRLIQLELSDRSRPVAPVNPGLLAGDE